MSDRQAAGASSAEKAHGISLIGLIALVISSAIGSGVFALSTDISAAASPGGALVAWGLCGVGFIALASTFGALSLERPDLHGLSAYAKEGFGPFVGFVSGWGYWLSIWMGIVAFGVMLATTLGYFFEPFAHGLTVWSIVVISLLDWGLVLLVNRGVEKASVLNAIVMVCKLVPIACFILAMIILFDPALFTADFWGDVANSAGGEGAPGGLPAQVVGCLMVMMWVFVGMEGATVLGHRARRAADVSRATVLGGIALVVIYAAASVLPYGFLPRGELMHVAAPSMPYLFERAVGSWGGAFISIGLIVSIFGASLSYMMLSSETMSEMAQMRLLPGIFGHMNTYGAPTASLVTTGAMVQVLAVVMLFSQAAYQFAYSLCTASIVISWSLAAAFQVKCAWGRRRGVVGSGVPGAAGGVVASGELGAVGELGVAGEAEAAPRARGVLGPLVAAGFSCAFLVAAVLISGAQLLLLCCIAYVPGIIFYIMARRQHGAERIMSTREWLVALGICLAATAAIIGLATQVITI